MLLALWGASDINPVTVILFLTLFTSVLIHELGHCFAARRLGGEAHEILLWPLGGLAFSMGADETPLKCLSVALAGPMTHLPTAALCAGILNAMGHPLSLEDWSPFSEFLPPEGSLMALYAYVVFKMQLYLFCFNVFLPAYPMDGGRIVVGLMSMRLSLVTTVTSAGVLTLLSSFWLFTEGARFLSLWLGFEAASLLVAATSPGLDWHPIARAFSQRQQSVEPEVPKPGLELRPCPHCGEMLHPRSELCVQCNARLS